MKKYYQKNYKVKIYSSYNLASLTTFKLGGRAEYFSMPDTLQQLKEAMRFAGDYDLKKHIIGGGSNLLISGNGVDGLVISTKKLNKIVITGSEVKALCGASVREINNKLINASLSGMEFSGGLPGSLGGAVFMNARAYGGEFSTVVEKAEAIDIDGKEYVFNKKEINFSYKKSIFTNRPDLFVYCVYLKLTKGSKKEIKAVYHKNINDRKIKGQYDYPSAGCVFKNDYNTNTIAGKLIEELGLKGTQIGKVKIFDKHANFIVKTGKADPDDVVKLINLIEKSAIDKKNIKLEKEIILIGF